MKVKYMDGPLQVQNQVLSVSFAPPVLHFLGTVQTSFAAEKEIPAIDSLAHSR